MFVEEGGERVGIKVPAHICRPAETQDVNAGIAMAVHMCVGLVAGITRIAGRGIKQGIAHLLHEERFLRGLRVAVAHFRSTVESKARTAVGGE